MIMMIMLFCIVIEYNDCDFVSYGSVAVGAFVSSDAVCDTGVDTLVCVWADEAVTKENLVEGGFSNKVSGHRWQRQAGQLYWFYSCCSLIHATGGV